MDILFFLFHKLGTILFKISFFDSAEVISIDEPKFYDLHRTKTHIFYSINRSRPNFNWPRIKFFNIFSGFFFMPPPPSGTSATVAQGTSYIPMSVNFLVPLLVPLACDSVQHKAQVPYRHNARALRHKFLSSKVSVGKRICL